MLQKYNTSIRTLLSSAEFPHRVTRSMRLLPARQTKKTTTNVYDAVKYVAFSLDTSMLMTCHAECINFWAIDFQRLGGLGGVDSKRIQTITIRPESQVEARDPT